MEHNEKIGNIKNAVLAKIRAGDVSMRPRLYFSLKIAAVVAVACIILALSVGIFNFILFSIRVSGHEPLLGFGTPGYVLFLKFFPWPLFVLDIGFIVLMQWMLQKFRFGYRSPAIYMLLITVVLVAGLSFGIDRGTSVNDRLYVRASHHELPFPVGGFYVVARRAPPKDGGFCRCLIESIENDRMVVLDVRDGATTTLQVVFPPNDLRATTTDLEKGDYVLVAGRREGDIIYAFGVREIDPNDPQPFHLKVQMPLQ